MKINSTFHVLVFLMTVLTFGMPFVTLAQQYSIQAEATAAGERDAEARTNKMVWRLLGCAGGLITVAATYFYEPAPPAGSLIGKSPEYVAYYADAYTQKAKDVQFRSAIEGCIAGTCVVTVLYVALVAVAVEEASSTGYYYY